MENKKGRPFQENHRDIILRIRITKEENDSVEKLAEKMGMNKSSLIRLLLFANQIDINILKNLKELPLFKRLIDFKVSLDELNFLEFDFLKAKK